LQLRERQEKLVSRADHFALIDHRAPRDLERVVLRCARALLALIVPIVQRQAKDRRQRQQDKEHQADLQTKQQFFDQAHCFSTGGATNQRGATAKTSVS
jgi:hypothetical protein